MLYIFLNLHLIIVLAFIILIQQLSSFGLSKKAAYKKKLQIPAPHFQKFLFRLDEGPRSMHFKNMKQFSCGLLWITL